MKFQGLLGYWPKYARCSRNVPPGFTLPELLVGVATASIVVAGLGYGLVTILGFDRQTQSDGERRVEIDRALGFISKDIREAFSVSLPTGYTISNTGPGGCAVNTPILHIQSRDSNAPGGILNTIYFLQDLSGCPDGTWLKPGVIMRISRNSAGTFFPANPPAVLGTTSGTNPLMDAVQEPTGGFSCSSGTQAGTKGVYVCIENPRSATIHIFGRGSGGATMAEQFTRIAVRGR